MATLIEAVEAVNRVTGTSVHFESGRVVECGAWWYIPAVSIGRDGYIVDKVSLAVDSLGSGFPLEAWFWAHDHGIVCDPVDFTVTEDVEVDVLTLRDIVSRFQRFILRSDGSEGCTWYFAHELDRAISEQFPIFRRHVVTSAIPQIKTAVERGELSFKCEKIKQPNQALQRNDPSCHVSCLRTPRASRGRG